MLTLFGINNCDTIRKTRQWLEEHGLEYEFHDYKKAGCSKELASRFLRHFELEQLINKRGTTWRRLPESIRQNLDEEAAVELMHEQPSIIKRPIINVGTAWIVGFDRDGMAAKLL